MVEQSVDDTYQGMILGFPGGIFVAQCFCRVGIFLGGVCCIIGPQDYVYGLEEVSPELAPLRRGDLHQSENVFDVDFNIEE